jgi:catechol 2,3-dioxygenase-like lactoylglutathione lyase family enzyme
MAGIVGAHHTSFTVAYLEQSLAFFRDVLGLELLGQREVRDEYFGRIVGLPGCAVRAALLRIPRSDHHVELFEYLQPQGQPQHPRPCDPGSSHLSLLVDDLPKWYQEWRGKGIAPVSEPVLITAGPNRGGYGLYLRDPNGILIELFQLPSGAAIPDRS